MVVNSIMIKTMKSFSCKTCNFRFIVWWGENALSGIGIRNVSEKFQIQVLLLTLKTNNKIKNYSMIKIKSPKIRDHWFKSPPPTWKCKKSIFHSNSHLTYPCKRRKLQTHISFYFNGVYSHIYPSTLLYKASAECNVPDTALHEGSCCCPSYVEEIKLLWHLSYTEWKKRSFLQLFSLLGWPVWVPRFTCFLHGLGQSNNIGWKRIEWDDKLGL